MKQLKNNPYIVGNPIKTKEMFFGRNDDFQFVSRKIGEGNTNQIIVFCGNRRSGKTSVLFQILNGRLGEKFLPILVDMQILAGIKEDRNFFMAILKAACGSLEMDELSIEALEPRSADNQIEHLFEAFLDYMKERYPGKTVLFLFDEYELIEEKIKEGSLSETSIHYLAGILESPYRVSFIFTGSNNLEQRKTDYWKILLSKSIYRKISYLSENDTRNLITSPVKDSIIFTEPVIERIFRLTAGQPFYTQVICQNLIDILIEEDRSQPTLDDIKKITGDIVDNPLPQMIYAWNSLSNWNRLTLSALAEVLEGPDDWATSLILYTSLKVNHIEIPFKKERINIFLEEAYHVEFLDKNDEDEYRFKMDLFRSWIKREHSIWKIVKELGLSVKKPIQTIIFGIITFLAVALIGVTVYFITHFVTADTLVLTNSEISRAKGMGDQETVKNMVITANQGPFRVVVDGSLSLTSKGLEDERSIIIPNLPKGEHNFVFYHESTGEKIERDFQVSADQQTYAVVFDKALPKINTQTADRSGVYQTGSIYLSSTPQGIRIVLDGVDTGLLTPNIVEAVSPGVHKITLADEGYKPEVVTLTVEENKTTKKQVDLVVTYGQLFLDIRPTAKVYLDDVFLIETPYAKAIPIQTGKHTLTVVNEMMGVKKKYEIEIKQDEILKIEEVLQ